MGDKKYIRTKIKQSLRKLYGGGKLSGHKLTRMNLLSSMISSILITGRSELAKMALGNPERKQYNSKRKQYKRVLLNKYIDEKTYYLPFILPLLLTLSASGTLVFSIDGSVVGNGCMCLMFSVIYQDKAIPIVWKVVEAKKGHLPESTHRDLLADLADIIPSGVRIIITGDGEFDGCDWLADITELGWFYVVKTSKSSLIKEAEEDEFKPRQVCLEQGADLFFEDIRFTKKKWTANLLIWHGKGHKEPLYLVTNLDYNVEIKHCYKKRFKIEPFFRDQKSSGFHIHKSGLRDPKRLQRLLIATCLAYIFGIMAGVKASQSKFYAEFIRTDGDFLSIFQKGYRFILFLVDIRQWRTFSWNRDFPKEQYIVNDYTICVPF